MRRRIFALVIAASALLGFAGITAASATAATTTAQPATYFHE